MLAKVIPARPDTGTGDPFSARIAYVCGKTTLIETVNLAGDWRDAGWQMRVAAGLAPACRKPACHVVLSWSPLERPSHREMLTAAKAVVQDFGGGDHHHVIALHDDRAHLHAHVILNRVHPVTGRVLGTSHDYARLEHACRRVEMRMGWPQDRGRFDATADGDDVRLSRKPAKHWQDRRRDREQGLRADSQARRAAEHRTGLPSLRDMLDPDLLKKLRREIDAAETWPGVHRILAAVGLCYQRFRSGARIAAMGLMQWSMPASQLGAACGLHRMESRLGAYRKEEARMAATLRLSSGPGLFDDPIWGAARTAVTAAVRAHKARAKACKDHRAAQKSLAARQATERRTIGHLLGRSRSLAAQALRRVMHDMQREEAARLRARRTTLAPPVNAMAMIDRLDPAGALRRRYRLPLCRALSGPDASGPEPRPAPDHTACRQAWMLAPAGQADIPAAMSAILAAHRDQLRSDGKGNLLLARRDPNGAIMAFDIVALSDGSPDTVRARGGGRGIGLLGMPDAPSCTLVPDATTALVLMMVSPWPSLIVVADPGPFDEMRDHLQTLIAGRPLTVVRRSDGPLWAGWAALDLPTPPRIVRMDMEGIRERLRDIPRMRDAAPVLPSPDDPAP